MLSNIIITCLIGLLMFFIQLQFRDMKKRCEKAENIAKNSTSRVEGKVDKVDDSSCQRLTTVEHRLDILGLQFTGQVERCGQRFEEGGRNFTRMEEMIKTINVAIKELTNEVSELVGFLKGLDLSPLKKKGN